MSVWLVVLSGAVWVWLLIGAGLLITQMVEENPKTMAALEITAWGAVIAFLAVRIINLHTT